jgi:hypothetical protein
LGDDEIKQETSFLSEKDRGVKGSSELTKNYIRATRGATTKFITLKALASSSTTTDTEEDGVISTSDISIMFQQCAQASKQLQEIVTQFDYHKGVEIPDYDDSSKPATNGQWANKTTNILEDTVHNSTEANLKTLVDDKFDVLPVDEQGGSVYLRLLFDIVYNMTEPVVRALHKWIKNFRRNRISKVIDENVLFFITTCKNICKRLDEIGQLPSDAVTDILEGLIKCSHNEFSDTFAHFCTLNNQVSF